MTILTRCLCVAVLQRGCGYISIIRNLMYNVHVHVFTCTQYCMLYRHRYRVCVAHHFSNSLVIFDVPVCDLVTSPSLDTATAP